MSREFSILLVDSVHSYNQLAGHLFFLLISSVFLRLCRIWMKVNKI